MRSLVVAPFSPWPRVFGGALRLWSVLEILAQRSPPDLLAYQSWSEPGDDPVAALKKICGQVKLLPQASSDPRMKKWLQLRSIADRRSFQYHSFWSAAFQRELDLLLEQTRPEVVVVEQSQMAFFNLDRARSAVRVLDLQNIEHELLSRRADVESKLIKKYALAWEAWKFAREERAAMRRFDVVLAPSERECVRLREELGSGIHVQCLPNTIDLERYPGVGDLAKERRLVFVGSCHVDANRDAVLWFVKSVLPRVVAAVPDVRLSVVGGDPPPEVRALAGPNVDIVGYVPDVRSWMSSARALVVPLRSGGGTRLKILEGLACGTAVVSTAIGAEGLELEANQDLLLADDEGGFADATIRLLLDDELADRLRRHGEESVKKRYSWQASAERLWKPIEAARAKRMPGAAHSKTAHEGRLA